MKILLTALLLTWSVVAHAQTITGMDEYGNMNQVEPNGRNFNPHNNDTTKRNKVIPKGIYVWTVDRKLGDIIKAEVDTLPDLYPQSTLGMGRHGEYNNVGSNYTARQSRIFINRPEQEQFIFTQHYDQVQKRPDQWHFTNTLSPITNLGYDNCGDKTNGEDHLNVKFAVNAGKRVGMGFDVDYAYARGYFQNQSISHFVGSLYTSYLGDRYQLHVLLSTRDQKATESGGITNDNYVTHPELQATSFSDNEIPTVLSYNWNRNHSQHAFFTHRYNLGFYRKVKMTEQEIKARKFAEASMQSQGRSSSDKSGTTGNDAPARPMGRPAGTAIAGKAPTPSVDSLATDSLATDSLTTLTLAADSLHNDSLALALQADSVKSGRIKVDSKAVADSLIALESKNDSLEPFMKNEFVPVTSFIHTLELDHYDRIYQAYTTPDNYYGNTYYHHDLNGYPGDSIYDCTKHLNIKNTLGIALLEGFNKWARAGVKVFATHELRRIDMPQKDASGNMGMGRWTEHNVSLGGRISKTQGKAFHYGLTGETWVVGEDAGQLKLDFNTDLNLALWGDTVRLKASAYFHRLNPLFYERKYHSKHLWWENNLTMPTRTRVEGVFVLERTKTQLRVAIEEMQNFTYYAMAYKTDADGRTALTAAVRQHGSNINVLTAQIEQKLQLGPLHWDNVLTYQSSSEESVLPLPTFNAFSNLYLRFMVAHVLRVELGGSATYFTKYYAPDFLPQLNQFAVQQNADSRVKIGNFPFIDVYANLHLKHARFFVMMNNVAAKSFDRMAFLTPHYPQNRSVLHMGVSWNFFN